MPELPIRFRPARIYELYRRLKPSFEAQPRSLAPDAVEEEPTPKAAFVFLLLFIFFSFAQLASWVPGAPNMRLPVPSAPEGLSYVLHKMRLSLSPAILSFIAAVIYKQSRGERFLFTGPQTYLLLALVGCGLVSVPYSYYPRASLNFVAGDLLKVFFLFVLMINVLRNARSIKVLLWTVAICGLIPAVGSILANLNPERFAFVDEPSGRYGWAGYFLNPNTVARTMCFLVPVALALIGSTDSSVKRALAFGMIFVYIFVMFKMLSRGAIVSLALIGVVYILTSRRKAVSMVLAMVVLAAAVVAVPGVMERMKTVPRFRRDASAMSRVKLWRAGVGFAFQRPLWGVGVSCYRLATARHFGTFSQDRGLAWKTPHSSYVQVMAEMGFPALFIYLGLLGTSLYEARKVHRRMERLDSPGARELARVSHAVFLALLAVMIVALTHSDAYDWTLHMLVALCVCVKQIARRYDVYV